MKLRTVIQQVQIIGKQHGFILILVGGGTIRLIGEKTHIEKIDTKRKILVLKNALAPTTQRSDKTLIDLDMIAFAENASSQTPEAFEKLQKELLILQKNRNFPPISLEPVLYHPQWKNPNTLMQFNSSIEREHQQYFFRLDTVKQQVQVTSLDTWIWQFAETPKEYILTFSPLALQLRYAIRGFARKPKDRQKIWRANAPFPKLVNQFREKTQNIYGKDFLEWYAFEKAIQTAKQPRIQAKRQLYQLFWQTIGTYFAHGTGFLGKLLLPFGNSFFSGK